MLLFLLAQVVLPLGLITWLAIAPSGNRTAYVVHTVATGLLLLALLLTALWTLLPWWLPYAYTVLWLFAVAIRTRIQSFRPLPLKPGTMPGWSVLLAMTALGVLGAILSWQGLQGRQLPDVRVVDLPLPMGPGIYLVVNGGSSETVNAHMKTLDPSVARFRAYRGQSYGIDLIKIDSFGLRASGMRPNDPAAYAIYGEPVHAPCGGTVVASLNDRPDMSVPDMDLEVIEGNHVLLDCGGFELLLAHFKRGSVRVEAGDRVAFGDQLGVVGNSGKTGEPHLHLSAQRKPVTAGPLSGEPLAIALDGRFVVRNDRIDKGVDSETALHKCGSLSADHL